MQLYNVSEKGELIEAERLYFKDSDVYVVDDNKIIYIWVGLNTSQNKKDFAADIARQLENKSGDKIKILIMKQGREYGSFLAMMEDLKKGLLPGITIERRPELKLESPSISVESQKEPISEEEEESEMEKNVKAWLAQLKEHRISEPDTKIPEQDEVGLEYYIREAAYYLSLENYSYDDLCWMLAEKILKYTVRMASIEDTKKKAEQVFNSSCTYDELCWLNAEMDLLIKKEYLKKELFISDLYK